jgi:hypothetical protein
MMAQSIADQLQAYGGTLDPDDEATESTKQSYITVSPKTPNANLEKKVVHHLVLGYFFVHLWFYVGLQMLVH